MQNGPGIQFYPADTSDVVAQAIQRLHHNQVVSRIWSRDYTLWSRHPDEVLNRLGWLKITDTMQPQLDDIIALAEELQSEGMKDVVILGMGGASLVAEVFADVFGSSHSGIRGTVLDSTHPAAIRSLHRSLDLSKTIFIFSMKKWALETFSLFKYFHAAMIESVGQDQAGQHFITITDVGAWVLPYAKQMNFRHIICNDPYCGGRYAALTHVGLVPAALYGIDIRKLLARAENALNRCQEATIKPQDNLGAWLGAVLGGLAESGRDKLVFFASPSLRSWLTWVEQLIAESTGKRSRGILPVIAPPDSKFEFYGRDCVFVVLEDSSSFSGFMAGFAGADQPVIHIQLQDIYDLGAQFVFWEFAIAVAGHILQIHPFDQPDVEATKIETSRLLEGYKQTGELSQPQPIMQDEIVTAYGHDTGAALDDVISHFLSQLYNGDYLAIQAYLPPEAATTSLLQDMQAQLQVLSHCATTIAYGPRFLHSSGQLHKGDAGKGHFIQITNTIADDLSIPPLSEFDQDELRFATLLAAQASGDWNALETRNRHILRLHIDGTIQQGLEQILTICKSLRK